MQDQTALVNDILPLNHVFRVGELEGKVFLVSQTFDFEDGSEGSLANFRHNFVELRWVVSLNLARR